MKINNDIKNLKESIFIKLALLFVISRVVFYYTINLNFVALLSQWQLADLELLRHDLLRTIWYMHAQPPLFNLFTGLFLKLFHTDENTLYAICIFFKVLTFFAIYFIYRTVYVITNNKKISFVVFAVLILHPTILLYENQFSYTQFEFFFISLSLYLFSLLLKQKEDKYIILLSFTLSMLCMMRSFFHPYLIILIVLAVVLLFGIDKIKTLIRSSVSLFVVIGWCYKNYVLYGVFSLTSFLGLNIAKIYKVEEGQLKGIPSFSKLDKYNDIIEYKTYAKPLALLNAKTTSLGSINLNNINYITVSNLYLKEIKKEYFNTSKLNKIIHKTIDACFIYFNPAGNYAFLYGNNKKMYPYARIFNVYLYNYDQDYKELWFPNDKKSCLLVIGLMLVLTLISGLYVYKQNKPFMFFFLFALMLMAYITTIGCLLEYGENNRFRYSSHPILFVFFGMTLHLIASMHKSKYKKII